MYLDKNSLRLPNSFYDGAIRIDISERSSLAFVRQSTFTKSRDIVFDTLARVWSYNLFFVCSPNCRLCDFVVMLLRY